MRQTPTSLEGLEHGAAQVDRRVDEQVARCLAAAEDPVALRQELSAFQGMKSQRAEFAYCLFSLDLARLGETEARASFARHAGILLEAYRDPDLTHYLLGDNPELHRRWVHFVPLLLEFDRARRAAEIAEPATEPGGTILDLEVAPDPEQPIATTMKTPSADAAGSFGSTMKTPSAELLVAVEATSNLPTDEGPPELAVDAVVQRAFAARSDPAALAAAMEAFAGLPPGPRVELALCLFNLDLVRLGVEAAKAEFAARTAILLEAYHDPARAQALVGESPGLRTLWADLVPYLDEFFEPPEPEEALEISLDDAVVVESPAGPPPPPSEASRPVAPRAPPPPPPDLTPPPNTLPLPTARKPSPSYRRLTLPPPPAPPPSTLLPSPETQAFWAHTEKVLELLPDENGMLSGKQAFSVASREGRTRLKTFAATVVERFPKSPEARSMGCLVELYLAAQLKEKTLFGGVNDKRQRAVQDALALLTSDPVAAGHAAVLFENDGVETLEGFGLAIEELQKFLAFCLKGGLDPLSTDAVQRYKP